MGLHGATVPPPAHADGNGDESPRALAPAAFELLERFQWGWVCEYEPGGREWVDVRRLPFLPADVWRSGELKVAARDAATVIQTALHQADVPLDRLRAILLDGARHLYLLALYELDARRWRLAKDVERDVAPGGQPLAICLGAWGGSAVRTQEGTGSRTIIEVVDHLGRFRRRPLGGYGGCLKTFPDAPYSRGNCWPCWCDVCEKSKSNAKAAAITAVRRRELLPLVPRKR